jgi:hypothetical protein
LHSLSKCESRVLLNRIKEKILLPLLENNITLEQSETDEDNKEDEIKLNGNGEPKWIDGGKLSAKTQREIEKMLDQKYLFPNFNMLLFAEEYLLKYAASQETREENREDIY